MPPAVLRKSVIQLLEHRFLGKWTRDLLLLLFPRALLIYRTDVCVCSLRPP